MEGRNHDYVVNLIKIAGDAIEMTILSTRKELPQMQSADLLEDTPIFAQLLGHEKIEHKVEPRMFQNRRRRGKQEKRGTNFSNTGRKEGESGDADKKDDKNKLRKRKKKKESTKKVKFEAGTDNVAFVDGENEEEKKKKKKRRKKKEKEGTEGALEKDKLSDEEDKRKHRRKSRRKKDDPQNDEEKMDRHKGNKNLKYCCYIYLCLCIEILILLKIRIVDCIAVSITVRVNYFNKFLSHA